MSNFMSFASYYDLLYQDKNYKREAEYISNLIREYSPQAETILNLGCGSGAHDFELVQKNFKIDGTDISAEMINKANEKLSSSPLKENLNFQKADLRNFTTDKKYDAVISLFHVFSYLTSYDDLRKAASTANQALKKDGILVFDCWYGPAVLTEKPSVKIKKLKEKDIEILRIAEPDLSYHQNTVAVNYTLFVKENGIQQNAITETHLMRYWFFPEIEDVFKHAGFKILKCKEWMSEKEPSENTWGVVFVMKKTN